MVLTCLFKAYRQPLSLFNTIRKSISSSPSRFGVVIISCLFIYKFFEFGAWNKNGVIMQDVESYYSYLPATFIYNDHDLGYAQEVQQKYPNLVFWHYQMSEIDKPVQKMTCGMSIMYAPFFFTAHGIASIAPVEADGYSKIYHFFLALAGLVYTILGLVLLRKILVRWFSELATTLALLSIYLASNIYYYVIYEGAMSHIYNLFLIICLLHFTIRYYENRHIRLVFAIGFVSGLLVLIRPTNVLFTLIFVLYGLSSKETIIARYKLLTKQWHDLALMIISAFLVCSLQLIYWKMQSGSWVYYSYNQETFYFLNPHILDGLFSYRKGYFVYSPLMILSLVGLPIAIYRNKELRASLLIIYPLFIWIVFSWWCWWYGGSFGNRAMIELCALGVFGLTAFYQWGISLYKHLKIAFFALLALAVFLNIFQTHQYVVSMIHYDSMTKEAYWHIFMKNSVDQDEFAELLMHPDLDNAGLGKEEYVGWSSLDKSNPQSEEVLLSNNNDTSNQITCTLYGFHQAKNGHLLLVFDEDDHFFNGAIYIDTIKAESLPTVRHNRYIKQAPSFDGNLKCYLRYNGRGTLFYKEFGVYKN